MLCLVQEHYRPDNWTLSAEEGMHCLTASITRTLAWKLDTVLDRVFPNTINEEHFKDNAVGMSTVLAGDEFWNKVYNTTFNSNKIESKCVCARVYYLKKADLNKCKASYHLRGRRCVTSVNNITSVVTCPYILWENALVNVCQQSHSNMPPIEFTSRSSIQHIVTKIKRKTLMQITKKQRWFWYCFSYVKPPPKMTYIRNI